MCSSPYLLKTLLVHIHSQSSPDTHRQVNPSKFIKTLRKFDHLDNNKDSIEEINDLDNAVSLFNGMLRMHPLPSSLRFN